MRLVTPKLDIPGIKPANAMKTAQLQLTSAVFTNSSFADTNLSSSSATNTIFFNGASLNLMPRLTDSTWLSANVNGGFVRFDDFEVNDYDTINAHLGIFQQLSRNMWGELGWRYGQYYVQGDSIKISDPKDLQEQGVRLAVNRIDTLPLGFSWVNNYEIQANFSKPVDRSRISHFFASGFVYPLPYNFQAGLFYRLKHDDFFERSTNDSATRHEVQAQLAYQFNRYFNVMGTVSYLFGNTIDLLRNPGSTMSENNMGGISFGVRLRATVPLLD